MKTDTLTSEKMTKAEAKKYFEENGVSSRSISEKLQTIIDLSDVGTDRERINVMIALANIDKVISANYKHLVDNVVMLKALKEFSGFKGNKVEDILTDENLFPLLSKIDAEGYKVSLTANSLVIQDDKGLIIVEVAGNGYEETIRNGIKDFLIKRGK